MPETQSTYDAMSPALAAERKPPFIVSPAADENDHPQPAALTASHVVSLDGRVIRLDRAGSGVEITIGGRSPVVLDRYQAGALQAVIDDILSGARL